MLNIMNVPTAENINSAYLMMLSVAQPGFF